MIREAGNAMVNAGREFNLSFYAPVAEIGASTLVVT